MFGQNNNHQDTNIPDEAIQGALQATDGSQATPQPDPQTIQPQQQWQHPGVPLDGAQPQPSPVDQGAAQDAGAAPTYTQAAGEPVNNDLIEIKQKALTQLSPLVGHLEQSPEEKFRTTMMMIQASDDQSLIPAAYEAANAIADEKAKAQALLDIVNEINYFTSHHQA